ncbi:hypothetical protein [Richelia intracellularis]|uniref:hypothetical protein n=1 Tax=Richelia intracellularis TaxID=1164990 RepID=UPI001E47C0E7|nr:hypothetical protein [Richelia intracellularis]
MSQSNRTYLTIPKTSEELICSEPWAIETYADYLMDELFADIDKILDGNKLPNQTVLANQIPQSTPQVTSVLSSNHSYTDLKSCQTDVTQLFQPASANLKRRIKKSTFQHKGGILVRILSLIIIVGLGVTSIVWLWDSGRLNHLESLFLQKIMEKMSK